MFHSHPLQLSLAIALMIAGGANESSAARGDWWLDANLTSWHSRDSYFWNGEVHRYNAKNLGLGLSYDLRDWCDVRAGWFNNSYHRTSGYAVFHPHYDLVRDPRWMVALGAGAGAVSGYNHTPDDLSRVSPLGILTLTIADERRWRVTVGYLPFHLVLGKNHADVATLQVGWKL